MLVFPRGGSNVVGATAAEKLLQGAKFVYTNGLDKVYMKPGNFRTACDDFDSVAPEKVKQFIRNGEVRKSDNDL